MDYSNERFRARWLTLYTVLEYLTNLAALASSDIINR